MMSTTSGAKAPPQFTADETEEFEKIFSRLRGGGKEREKGDKDYENLGIYLQKRYDKWVECKNNQELSRQKAPLLPAFEKSKWPHSKLTKKLAEAKATQELAETTDPSSARKKKKKGCAIL